MYNLHCLNPISKVGLDNLSTNYVLTDDVNVAQGILVRSAAMHDMELSDNLLAVARAGAGVNNIPLDKCVEKGIVVFNTPGANANGVKELVIAGLLLASRDIIGGANWVVANNEDEAIAKTTEMQKKHFAGGEIHGKALGVIGLGAIGIKVANAADSLGMNVMGYKPNLSVEAARRLNPNVKYVTDLNDIFTTCDYITVHVPALPTTRDMIPRITACMDEAGISITEFVNKSRGEVAYTMMDVEQSISKDLIKN